MVTKLYWIFLIKNTQSSGIHKLNILHSISYPRDPSVYGSLYRKNQAMFPNNLNLGPMINGSKQDNHPYLVSITLF